MGLNPSQHNFTEKGNKSTVQGLQGCPSQQKLHWETEFRLLDEIIEPRTRWSAGVHDDLRGGHGLCSARHEMNTGGNQVGKRRKRDRTPDFPPSTGNS